MRKAGGTQEEPSEDDQFDLGLGAVTPPDGSGVGPVTPQDTVQLAFTAI
jgi:hypothetical protein